MVGGIGNGFHANSFNFFEYRLRHLQGLLKNNEEKINTIKLSE